MIEKDKKSVKLVIKNYPLPMHKYAREAAAAALAAGMEGKYWEFHDELFKNAGKLSDKKIREIATKLGLDANKIEKEMKSKKIQGIINRDIKDADKAGVIGTPTVFINGRLLRNPSLKGFQHMIDAQLKKQH